MALMSQIFVVTVRVQLYKCTCLLYFLWCIHLKCRRQIYLKFVGFLLQLIFKSPLIILFIFTNHTSWQGLSVSLTICHFVITIISLSVFLSFRLFVLVHLRTSSNRQVSINKGPVSCWWWWLLERGALPNE